MVSIHNENLVKLKNSPIIAIIGVIKAGEEAGTWSVF